MSNTDAKNGSVPDIKTWDAFDLRQDLEKRHRVPCSNCGENCLHGSTIGVNNPNPCHPPGENATYVIPVCSRECKEKLVKTCVDVAPYPLGSEKGGEVVFSFDTDADVYVGNGADVGAGAGVGAGVGVGAEKELYYGFWTMGSLIPEDGRWVICKCTDTGKIITDERGRPIWRLVEHSLFQKSCPVYN
jgi:hypothetical protein